mgnify:CR=1 FL=1
MALAAWIARWVAPHRAETFQTTPLFVWTVFAGVLAALYLALPLIVYPKQGGGALIAGAVVGILLWMVLPQLVVSIFALLESMDTYLNEISGWVAALLQEYVGKWAYLGSRRQVEILYM